MPWRVTLAPLAERQLRAVPEEVERRVVRRLRVLRDDPRPQGSLKLAGRDGAYRLRVGDYRILYRIEDAVLVVLVIAVGHRRDVYR